MGSWEMSTAAKMRAQPKNSRLVGTWLSSRMPPRTENTDSRLMSRVATVGAAYCCPTTCKV